MAQLDPNDPWPKHGQNAENTFRGPNFGPHSSPELRWWSNRSALADVGYPDILPGAAIGWFGPENDQVRCVVYPKNVPAAGEAPPQVSIHVYRYHPCPPYDPTDPADPIWKIDLGEFGCDENDFEQIGSTPLILDDDRVIIQTTRRVLCFDFSELCASTLCSAPPDAPDEPVWVYPDGEACFVSVCSSPAVGMTRTEDGAPRIFVHGNGKLVALSLGGQELEQADTISCDMAFSTPAIGPIAGDEDHRNFVYVTAAFAFDPGTCEDLDHKLFAYVAEDFSNGVTGEITGLGASASPGVNGDGRVLVPADDGHTNLFQNAFSMTRLWHVQATVAFISASAAIFPNGNAMVWHENLSVALVDVSGTVVGFLPRNSASWIWGSPAADALRWYNPHRGARIRCYRNEVDDSPGGGGPFDIYPAWGYRPVSTLEQPFVGAPAIDADGTLICPNTHYLLALRPVVGDFNGDGCRNNFDIDALALGLLDEEDWRETYGDPLGINYLGVCDCNNDGACNNYDLDCLVDALLYDPSPCGESAFNVDDGEPPSEEENRAGGGSETPGGESGASACEPSAADIAHFWETVYFLRSYFGME